MEIIGDRVYVGKIAVILSVATKNVGLYLRNQEERGDDVMASPKLQQRSMRQHMVLSILRNDSGICWHSLHNADKTKQLWRHSFWNAIDVLVRSAQCVALFLDYILMHGCVVCLSHHLS